MPLGTSLRFRWNEKVRRVNKKEFRSNNMVKKGLTRRY